MKKLVIGIDFDGTIVVSKYPSIGQPKFLAISVLRWLTKRHTVILWTCREGRRLDEAIKWCKQRGVEFQFVNCNSFERIRQYNGDCRKLSCDMLIDDVAGFVFWPWVLVRVLFKEVRAWLVNGQKKSPSCLKRTT